MAICTVGVRPWYAMTEVGTINTPSPLPPPWSDTFAVAPLASPVAPGTATVTGYVGLLPLVVSSPIATTFPSTVA